MTDKESRIPLLKGAENWSDWSFRIKTAAVTRKASKILLGEEAAPVDTTSAAFQLFETKKHDMFNLIVESLSPAILVHLRSSVEIGDTAKAWQIFSDFFESKTAASVKQMLSQLLRTRQTDSVVDFVNEVDILRANLTTAVAEKK